jgi:hypothetical protein
MKKLLTASLVILALISCKKKEDNPKSSSSSCGDHKSQPVYLDAQGCYYMDAAGNKQYVERHECKC